jgi:hypothetical protein
MAGKHRRRPCWPDVERDVMLLLGIAYEAIQVIRALRGL